MAGFGSSFDFWIVVIGLTIGIAVLLVLSLAASRRPQTEGMLDRDIQIYRDQLSGVERDMARGTLSQSEGLKLKTEVARRLLEADRRGSQNLPQSKAQSRRALLLPAAIILAALAGGVYLYTVLGQPQRLDLPLATRLAEADARLANRPAQEEYLAGLQPRNPPTIDASLASLMEKLRQAVDPSTATDLQGLGLLASNEARLGNFANAITAQNRLIAVKAPDASAADHVALAEMLMAQAEGYVSPEAETALRAALALDAQHLAAQYYLGLLNAQGGRFDRAFAIWQPLMERSTLADPWAARLQQDVVLAAEAAGVRYSPPALKPGPDAPTPPSGAEAATAGEASAADALAAGAVMVERLGTRLAQQGGSAAEWAQLIKALSVLDRRTEALEILAEARQIYAQGEDRALIEATARETGLEAAE